MKALYLSGAAGLALGLGALLVGAVQAQDGRKAARTGPATAQLQEGKDIYAHWCTPCHADVPSLAGTMSLQAKYNGSVPAALEDRTNLQPAVITYFVRNGIAWMPPFRPTEISDEELAALSDYLVAPLKDRGAHTLLLADEMMRKQGSGQ